MDAGTGCSVAEVVGAEVPCGGDVPFPGCFSHTEIGLRNNGRNSPARPILVNLTLEVANWGFLESQWRAGSALEPFTPFFHLST